MTVLRLIFWANGEESGKPRTWVLSRTDRINFNKNGLPKFGLYWEKRKVLWEWFSQIYYCDRLSNYLSCKSKSDLFLLKDWWKYIFLWSSCWGKSNIVMRDHIYYLISPLSHYKRRACIAIIQRFLFVIFRIVHWLLLIKTEYDCL